MAILLWANFAFKFWSHVRLWTHWKGTFRIILLTEGQSMYAEMLSSWWRWWCGGVGDLMWELLNSLLISLGRRVLHLRLIQSFWSHAWLPPACRWTHDILYNVLRVIQLVVSEDDNWDIKLSLSCDDVMWCDGLVCRYKDIIPRTAGIIDMM